MKRAQIIPVQRVYLSNSDAQAYLGVGPEFLRGLRESAELPFRKVGRTIFYKIEDINRIVEKGKVI